MSRDRGKDPRNLNIDDGRDPDARHDDARNPAPGEFRHTDGLMGRLSQGAIRAAKSMV